MKTKIISLSGEPQNNLYQLGLKERDAFRKIENRVSRLLSTNTFLRQGQDILTRAKTIMKKRKKASSLNASNLIQKVLGSMP